MFDRREVPKRFGLQNLDYPKQLGISDLFVPYLPHPIAFFLQLGCFELTKQTFNWFDLIVIFCGCCCK